MSDGQIIPPGQHDPFAVVSADDHRAWILVAGALGISFTLVTLITRVLIRLFVNRGWGLDDTLCVASTVLSWMQAALVLAASGRGLGKAASLIAPEQQGNVQRLYYASNIFYILALGMSKLSVVLFLRRLVSPGSMLRKATLVLAGVIPVSTLVFIIATSLQCDLLQPWDVVGDSCPSWFLRWEIHGIVECLFEVAIVALPILLVWKLQTGTENKAEVVAPFAFRLVLIIFTALRLDSFNTSGFPRNFTLREAPFICWTQAELSYSIIAATIPTARRLMLDFITYYNGGNFNNSRSISGTTSGAVTRGGRTGNSIPMKSFRSEAGKSGHAYANGSRGTTRGQDPDVLGDGDGDSQENLVFDIRKDVSIRVDNNGRELHDQPQGSESRPNFI